jgi:AcrR family transcriptional regulator
VPAQTAPLSRERILACAVAVADRDGLEAASLRRVATELGVHVTSLYNHVPTKEALLDGVVESLFAGADLPLGVLPWEAWVRRFVDAIASVAQHHPGAFAVLLRRPVQGAQATATFETGLAAFHAAGMSPQDAYAAVKSVALAVLGCCAEQAYGAAGMGQSTDVAKLSPRDFPLLHEAAATVDELDLVAAVRELLVAGLARQLRTARSSGSARR